MFSFFFFSFSIFYWESHTYETTRVIHITIFGCQRRKIGLGLGQSKLIEDPHHYLIFLTPSWGRRSKSKQACFHFISYRWTKFKQNTAVNGHEAAEWGGSHTGQNGSFSFKEVEVSCLSSQMRGSVAAVQLQTRRRRRGRRRRFSYYLYPLDTAVPPVFFWCGSNRTLYNIQCITVYYSVLYCV